MDNILNKETLKKVKKHCENIEDNANKMNEALSKLLAGVKITNNDLMNMHLLCIALDNSLHTVMNSVDRSMNDAYPITDNEINLLMNPTTVEEWVLKHIPLKSMKDFYPSTIATDLNMLEPDARNACLELEKKGLLKVFYEIRCENCFNFINSFENKDEIEEGLKKHHRCGRCGNLEIRPNNPTIKFEIIRKCE